MPTSSRQLAAIMFTDIVGYTALMGKNSNKALDLVRISKEIQKPLVEKHNGKWLKEMGDGAMAQFSSALDAVNCALEIQRTSRADFGGDLRIGIHLGDITIEDNDVYGDGVNVAARLESIADPGGIYISESIEKAIRGQSDVQAKYLGEINLKNVDYEVRTYALQGIGIPVPDLKNNKDLSGRLFAEIKRRGVIRAGIMYILTSLLIGLLLPLSTNYTVLPDFFKTALIALLAIGFPMALYLAWRYERSPGGFVRSSSQKSWQNPLNPGQRKPFTSNILIGFLATFILILSIYTTKKSVTTTHETQAIIAPNDLSIAVLPFENISNDPEQEYFSAGMMEEILNHLYKIGDLSVTSRTSTMRYKNTTKSIREIGKELGVVHILEGSVRKDENQVRITVQLIDVDSDAHLWAENYDRELKNVFEIQSEVAKKIAEVLKAEISPEIEEILKAPPTNNTEAYNLYLKARSMDAYDEKINSQAIKLLNEAIKLDPDFSNAYLAIGMKLQVGATVYATDKRMDPTEAWLISKPYIQKALELDPDNGYAHQRMAWSLLWFEWDFKAAQKEYLEVKRIFPNYSWTDYHIVMGQFDEAILGATKEVELDPNSPVVWAGKILSQYFAGQNNESLKTINSALMDTTINGRQLVAVESFRVWMYLGRYADIIRECSKVLDTYPKSFWPPRLMAIASISYFHLGQSEKSAELLKMLINQSEINAGASPSFYIAMIYCEMGEIDEAFKWLENSYEDHEVELHWLKVEPPFRPLRDDPRWQIMLDKVGFLND